MTPLPRTPEVRPWSPTIDPLAPTRVRAQTPDELVTLYAGDVWRFAAAQVRPKEDAEDVVMETFAAAFRDFARVQKADDQGCWLLAIARKKVADLYRRRYRRAESPLPDEHATGDDEMNAQRLAMRTALARLPQGQREALTLKYVNGLTIEEVGKTLRRSTAATNSLLQRGRESLRDALGLSATNPNEENR